jgi:hypothetical protein
VSIQFNFYSYLTVEYSYFPYQVPERLSIIVEDNRPTGVSEKLPINQGVWGISLFVSHEDLMALLKIKSPGICCSVDWYRY